MAMINNFLSNLVIQNALNIPKIPIADGTELFTKKITKTFSFLFEPIKDHFGFFMKWTAKMLSMAPPVVVIIIVAILAFILTGRRLGLAAFSIVGLWLIYNQGYWEYLMETFSLVLISSLLSVIIGVPVGIL